MRTQDSNSADQLANINCLLTSLKDAVAELESADVPDGDRQIDFYDEVERFEISLIRSALQLTGGSQVKAARLLNLNATTLNAKIKHFSLRVK
jgi:DNA-binding protein Fis